MTNSENSSTHMSLIGALFSDPGDIEKGTAFLDKYRPLILGVARDHGLSESDAEDVVQDTLQKMLNGFRNFNRQQKGSFRKWLRTIARSATINWFNHNPALDPATAEAIGKSISQSLAKEYHTEVMEAAIRKARLEFHPRTWTMFEQARLEDRPAQEVADELGVSVLTVYGATQRVGNRLKELFTLLDQDDPE